MVGSKGRLAPGAPICPEAGRRRGRLGTCLSAPRRGRLIERRRLVSPGRPLGFDSTPEGGVGDDRARLAGRRIIPTLGQGKAGAAEERIRAQWRSKKAIICWAHVSCHCERSEAIWSRRVSPDRDCFVAALRAMTADRSAG